MKDIFLAFIVFGLFIAFGYFIIGRFGQYMDENYRTFKNTYGVKKKIYITDAAGKSAEEIAEEVRRLIEAKGRCEVIIWDTADTELINYLEAEGRIIEYCARR